MTLRFSTLTTLTLSIAAAVSVGCHSSSDGATPLRTSSPQVLPVPNKIDILFMIDNSASMGDKQAYLQQAIPSLVARLVTPNCVDPADPSTVYGASSTQGAQTGICAQGQVEFPPIQDLHLGIVSSSLGTRGGDLCPADAQPIAPFAISAHNDDQAHLLDRTLSVTINPPSATEGTLAAASPMGFLSWSPGTAAPGDDAGAADDAGASSSSAQQLVSNFEQLVSGVGYFGCGIESQLESWYRFLIQPDPYADIALVQSDGAEQATWQGVDATILEQRHDFLRPDSVVAIVDLSDENDSEIDVRAVSGSGYNFMVREFDPPHGTSACASNPADPSCTSCDFLTSGQTDPSCPGTYSALNDWGYDPNLRHVHMKQKYGVDAQFPIDRYLNGLTSTTVPDRTGEYPDPTKPYAGDNDCTNPLFAASLPDGTQTDAQTLCNLPPGNRPASFVFYHHIGGVPQQLLHFDPNSPANSALTAADWVKILGADPESYDYTGIDPHMIESYQPDRGLTGTPQNPDPINGYDWTTTEGAVHVLNVDREYACIFPLAQPRDCTLPGNAASCDCPPTTGLTGIQIPPVCDYTNQTSQVAGKAYPTIRELLLAKKLGPQATVSSICPLSVDPSNPTAPVYGYNPSVSLLVNQMTPLLQTARPDAG